MAEADVQLHDFQNIFSLTGKVAVVSGGSRGLGLHAASGLMQAGCSKIFITSRKSQACEEAVAALNALPGKAKGAKAYAVPADSSKVADIERLVQEVGRHTDHVDVLFANAGATWGQGFDRVEERNGWDRVMDLNVKGVFFTIQKYVLYVDGCSDDGSGWMGWLKCADEDV
jgi:NAD(P)-dependent dehydrogenase (short-subunit alcohol dehydrogenase family)